MQTALPQRPTRLTATGFAAGLQLLLAILFLTHGAASATAGDTNAKVAASGQVVVKTIDGTSTWIREKDDNCAAAVVTATWGSECPLVLKRCWDAGYWSAECEKEIDNVCGVTYANAWSREGGPLDAAWPWWTAAWATAKFSMNEEHKALSWAKATVDGVGSFHSTFSPLTEGPAHGDFGMSSQMTEWEAGTALVSVEMDTIQVETVSRSSWFEARLVVDGAEVWTAKAALAPDGSLDASGGIPAEDYTVEFTGDTWSLSIYDFVLEYPIQVLGEGDSIEVPIQFEMVAQSEDVSGAGPPPTYVPVGFPELTAVDEDGIPVLNGEHVSFAGPAVVLSDGASFHPFLDTDVTDGSMAVGLVDPFFTLDPGAVPAGDLLEISGRVTHHEGRTVLVDIEAVPVAHDTPVPPPMGLSIAEALDVAEFIEGMPVGFTGLTLVDPDQWRGGDDDALVTVQDPSGAQIDLAISGHSWPDSIPPPDQFGPFDAIGIFSQFDPDGLPYFDGYQLRLRGPFDLFPAPPSSSEDPLESTGTGAIDELALQSGPNPTSGPTTIRYQLPRETQVSLSIHDIQGRRVATLANGNQSAGWHRMNWDGRTDDGRSIPPGVYFARLTAGQAKEAWKIEVLR